MPYIPTLPPSRAAEPRKPETSKPLGGSPIPGKAVPAVPGFDPYEERMQAALAQINQPDYMAGMIPWLGENRPDLYHQLTSFLPDVIDWLWNEHALLAEFQATLDKLVEAHRLAVLLYRESGPRT